jgi:type II secretory pathway predicted ATPase ExeA
MIDAYRRLGPEVSALIADAQYFIIHAARQSGKTTLLKDLTRRLHAEGQYYALYCSLENVEGIADPKEGLPAIINAISRDLLNADMPNASAFKKGLDMADYTNAAQNALTAYCRSLNKPLVIFFDEADCLSGQTLINFLRQLRNGYVNRYDVPFVHSLALVGLRNIRDYRDEYRPPNQSLGTASPFNITAPPLTLRNFTFEEITELYAQHTADTGQVFQDDAVDRVWDQTQGQPWLVNAIANEIVRTITMANPLEPISVAMVSNAIHAIVTRRDSHFDSLMARLREERVRRIIEPVITGGKNAIERLSDDYSYVKDLGLIRDDHEVVEPANPIYADIMVRSLNWDTHSALLKPDLPYQLPRYMRGGAIDMDYLLRDFQAFWRENGAIWKERYDYKEAAGQLVLQAFLQRVLNGGGSATDGAGSVSNGVCDSKLRYSNRQGCRFEYQFAAETGRADLCVEYEGKRYPIELKIRYSSKTLREGLEQLSRYMDTLGCERGWLVLFDQRKSISWAQKLYARTKKAGGKVIRVYGA